MRTLALTAFSVVALLGCEEKSNAAAPSRFAGVTKSVANQKAQSFCDHAFEEGKGKTFELPPTRPLAGARVTAPSKGWRWVNVWATWCGPCVEEMGLLARWRDGFAKDGLDVGFELLSIDAAEDEEALKGWVKKDLPGHVSWVRKEEDFFKWLETMGVDKSAAIPIHVLVAPNGRTRCIRVGAIHEQDYGAVRAMIAAQ